MDNTVIRGRVHKFGDNINTDLINPAQYMELSIEEMTKHAMEGVDPSFSLKVKPGDIMVAGKNFGSGSSRETAPVVIKNSGISVVIAEFFARIFYRNAINIGLKVLTCPEVNEISDGDELEVDLVNGVIHNISSGKRHTCSKLSDNIIEMVNDGGLIEHLIKSKKGSSL
jgi:3-isopropylmalate/(R)-2-methylmalate dehydratase small subunit